MTANAANFAAARLKLLARVEALEQEVAATGNVVLEVRLSRALAILNGEALTATPSPQDR